MPRKQGLCSYVGEDNQLQTYSFRGCKAGKADNEHIYVYKKIHSALKHESYKRILQNGRKDCVNTDLDLLTYQAFLSFE